jgi:hypothetical protein
MEYKKKMPKHQHLIVAPHPDDEIIGCYEVINNKENSVVIMYSGNTDANRRQEALKLRESRENIIAQIYQNSIPSALLTEPNITFYFPDPINEIHPLHRAWGSVGEGLARDGKDVIFYTTLMNVPYIHEVNDPTKEDLLNNVYPSQKTLWEYEKKFILFEGRCKWIF